MGLALLYCSGSQGTLGCWDAGMDGVADLGTRCRRLLHGVGWTGSQVGKVTLRRIEQDELVGVRVRVIVGMISREYGPGYEVQYVDMCRGPTEEESWRRSKLRRAERYTSQR